MGADGKCKSEKMEAEADLRRKYPPKSEAFLNAIKGVEADFEEGKEIDEIISYILDCAEVDGLPMQRYGSEDAEMPDIEIYIKDTQAARMFIISKLRPFFKRLEAQMQAEGD